MSSSAPSTSLPSSRAGPLPCRSRKRPRTSLPLPCQPSKSLDSLSTYKPSLLSFQRPATVLRDSLLSPWCARLREFVPSPRPERSRLRIFPRPKSSSLPSLRRRQHRRLDLRAAARLPSVGSCGRVGRATSAMDASVDNLRRREVQEPSSFKTCRQRES